MRDSICLPVLATCLFIAACAQVPQKLQGTYADVDTTQASTEKFRGLEVRWGGVISGKRMTDGGECAEISWYPLNALDAKPQLGPVLGISDGASRPAPHIAEVGVGYAAYGPIYPMIIRGSGWGRLAAAPRFLACGGSLQGNEDYFVGAVVTITGIVLPSSIFEVEYADCLHNVSGNDAAKAIYASNVVATQDTTCVVSLPTIRVATAHTWKEQPRFNPDSRSVFNGY